MFETIKMKAAVCQEYKIDKNELIKLFSLEIYFFWQKQLDKDKLEWCKILTIESLRYLTSEKYVKSFRLSLLKKIVYMIIFCIQRPSRFITKTILKYVIYI